MPDRSGLGTLLNNPFVEAALAAHAVGAVAGAYQQSEQRDQQDAMAHALATGGVTPTMPRTGLSGLIAKTGLISPTYNVDQGTQDRETLALQDQQLGRLKEIETARTDLGPGIAKAPGLSALIKGAGLTPDALAAYTPKEQATIDSAKERTAAETERVRHDTAMESGQASARRTSADNASARLGIEKQRLKDEENKPDKQYISTTVTDADGTNHVVVHAIDKRSDSIKTIYDAKAGSKGSGKLSDQQTRINAFKAVHEGATDADALEYIDSKKVDRAVDTKVREMQAQDKIKQDQETRSLKAREDLAKFSAGLRSTEDLTKALTKPFKSGDNTYTGQPSRDPVTGQPAIKWTNQTPGIGEKVFGPSPPIYTPVSLPTEAGGESDPLIGKSTKQEDGVIEKNGKHYTVKGGVIVSVNAP